MYKVVLPQLYSILLSFCRKIITSHGLVLICMIISESSLANSSSFFVETFLADYVKPSLDVIWHGQCFTVPQLPPSYTSCS